MAKSLVFSGVSDNAKTKQSPHKIYNNTLSVPDYNYAVFLSLSIETTNEDKAKSNCFQLCLCSTL